MATFEDYKIIFSETYKGKSLNSYCSYVKTIERLYRDANGNKSIGDLINKAIKNREKDPIDWLLKQVNIGQLMPTWDSKDSYISGLKKFAEVVFGVFYANIWMSMVTDDDLLCSIVAQNALFASKDIVNAVKDGILGADYNIEKKKSEQNYNNPFASWDYMSSYRKNRTPVQYPSDFSKKYPGTLQNDEIIADDNTYANRYIKTAILRSIEREYGIKIGGNGYRMFHDYEACHVWDLPGDRRYYASIANLVLLPRALAQLTDHNDAVKNLLRYEVQERFKFIPDGHTRLDSPKNYSTYNWRKLYKNQQYEFL